MSNKSLPYTILVLGIYLGYLVYLSTWSTVLDPNPDSKKSKFMCFQKKIGHDNRLRVCASW